MAERFKTLEVLEPKGKRVLVRVDFNVPMQDGEITDPTRIERATVTIRELREKGGKVVVLSHFGRPKGQVQPAMSLKPIAAALGKSLGDVDVAFASDCIGDEADRIVSGLGEGQIVLLENLRFHSGEERNDPAFADALALLGDAYVNDAFSCSHRAHASVVGLADRLPAYAGRLMQAELEALEAAVGGAERPTAAIIGGAKVSTKLEVLGHLLERMDTLIIGGGMANTFLNAQGKDVGKSLCERDLADNARAIMAAAETKGVEIVLPSDAVVATEFKEEADTRTCTISEVRADEMILDIGPGTIAQITGKLEASRTLIWNGPLGAFEVTPFDQGTNMIATAAAELTRAGRLKSIAGGGDTVSALIHADVLDDFSYVSTAGGAFLEWLEGKELPGVAALRSG